MRICFRDKSSEIRMKFSFEMPPFRDPSRWNARILSNLLYFQTNYFAVVLVFVAVWSLLHATDTVVGLSAIVVLGAVVSFSLSRRPALAQVIFLFLFFAASDLFYTST